MLGWTNQFSTSFSFLALLNFDDELCLMLIDNVRTIRMQMDEPATFIQSTRMQRFLETL